MYGLSTIKHTLCDCGHKKPPIALYYGRSIWLTEFINQQIAIHRRQSGNLLPNQCDYYNRLL